MAEFTDKKFINLVSGQLQHFKWKSATLANFRCPICGDSQKNKTKCRGYFYLKSNSYFYRCHNCNFGSNVKNFLDKVAPTLAQEYQLETFNESFSGRKKRKKEEIPDMNFVPFKTKERGIVKMSSVKILESDHKCKKFVLDRKIPEKYHEKLFYVEDFNSFAKIHINDSVSFPSEERLVIPFVDENDKIYAAQGRRLDSGDSPKYYTAKPSETSRLWYNLHQIDVSKPVVVLEGPIDSMFIPNSVALVGSGAITDLPEKLKSCKLIYALDNEPRNKQIVSYYEKLIKEGMSVCLWPSSVSKKDVNEMILSGMTSEEIHDIILNHSYDGLEASLKIKDWKKL